MTEDPSASGSGTEPGQPQPAQPEVAAGWYPHPTAPGWEAYWTGTGWGTETRPAPAPAPVAPDVPAGAEQTAAQPTAQEPAATSPEPATGTAAAAAPVSVGAGPRTAGPPAADRPDSALPAILCILGALVAIVGAFLPEAKLDFSGTPVDLADNTMVAAGYGIAVIAAAVIGAAIAAWAYVKAARTWLPILLGAVIVAIAVYAGTAGLDVTPDFAPSGLSLDDAGDPSTGIFAVAAGGLLMVLGGIGLARESR